MNKHPVKCSDWNWPGSEITRCNGKAAQSVICAKYSPVIFSKPGMPLEIPAGQCSPVSVLDRKVLLHSFHQVPETLGKDFLLGERLAVDQACSQFTEILLGERQCQLGSNSKPRRKPGQPGSTCAPWYSGVCIHTELSILRENLSCISIPRCS